jgi:hypothetical protein
MSNITADMNTMNSAKTAGKRVAKKTDTVTVTVAATPVAPVVAEVKAKVAKKVAAPKAEAVAAPAVAAAAPEAQAVTAAPAPVKSVSEEIAALTKELNDAKETLRKASVALKGIERKHGQEIKEARKRRKQKKVEVDGEVKPARPSVFTTPVLLKDSLATLLGKPKGTKMSPADVTRAVKVYINEHALKGEKHAIHHDARMYEVLGVKADETLTYKNIQKYLYQLYIKEPKIVA